ncbi:MAG: sulfate ABC transporter substrate-binding protein [Acutalibacteraceae bacterium]|nr:sulfate ABC transporter substrate-binding protein [Acutalibacteraceae bacterium]
MIKERIISLILAGAAAITVLSACSDTAADNSSANSASAPEGTAQTEKITLTNVSYDPTRELYQKYNETFVDYYKNTYGGDIEIIQSHGGSGSQARSVIEGAQADVVTLALAHDITLIEQSGLIESGWLNEFDLSSSPYTSTIVFLVRKGNPKQLNDWDDLTKQGVEIINPDPKSSGGACWNFLAAWKYALDKNGNDGEKAKEFVRKLYANVTVMDSGARGATTTFVENGQGDVLIAWENEAINSVKEYPNDYEIVTPSISILAQPSVAIVDTNAKKNGTADAAKIYLEYLYSDEAQKIIGENGYRPTNEEILKSFSDKFDLNVNLCTIDDFGGWDAAYETFFDDGAIFDEIYDY